jgi:hypothetical protein
MGCEMIGLGYVKLHRRERNANYGCLIFLTYCNCLALQVWRSTHLFPLYSWNHVSIKSQLLEALLLHKIDKVLQNAHK